MQIKALGKIDPLPLIALGSVWAMLVYQLQVTWSVNPQYSYGWLVPALSLFMIWRQGHKAVLQPLSKEQTSPREIFLNIIIILGCMTLLPMWIIREANPDWRLLNWVFAFNVLGITYSFLAKEYSLSNLRYYIYPTLFFLVAVPWPLAWDAELTLFLQEKVSIIVTELLWFLGYPAKMLGSVIVLPTGPVGIDEACSGIRGLQGSLVVALFLGYYYQLPIWFRIPFCFLGMAIAFVINIVRAFTLTYLSAANGPESINTWHDPAGITESVCTFIVLFGFAILLSKIFNHNPDEEFEGNFKLLEFSKNKFFSFAVISWVAICVTISFGWYYYKEIELKDTPLIQIEYPTTLDSFESQPISDTIRSQLHYSDAASAIWIDPETKAHMQGFFCHWKTGDGSPSILAIHRPDQCLGSRGLQLKARHPNFTIAHLGYIINLEAYTFGLGKHELHVFRCIWPDKTISKELPEFPKAGYDLGGRIKAAVEGKRNTGNRLIVFAVKEVRNFDMAKTIATQQFITSIQPTE